MSHNPTDRCTRCGGTGHSLSECKWPSEVLPSRRPMRVRLGLVGYIGILAALGQRPMTYRGIQEASGIGRSAVYPIIDSFRALKLAHIAGWSERPDAPFEPIFFAGNRPDALPPTMRSNGRPAVGVRVSNSKKPRAEIVALASLLRAIEHDALSADEICEETGMAHTTVRLAMAALRENGMAYIASIDPPGFFGGPGTRRYKLGRKADARAPEKQSRAEIQQRYRSRKIAKQTAKALIALAGSREAVVA